MHRFLVTLLTSLRRLLGRPSSLQPGGQVRPTVEALEDRQVPSAAGVPHLAHLHHAHPAEALIRLEARLNLDPRARAQFFADPGAVLRAAGVALQPAQEQALLGALAHATGQLPNVAGASVTPLQGPRQAVVFEAE